MDNVSAAPTGNFGVPTGHPCVQVFGRDIPCLATVKRRVVIKSENYFEEGIYYLLSAFTIRMGLST